MRIELLDRIVRAFSTFSIFPTTDYLSNISTSNEMLSQAWRMTGDLLYQAVEKVGGQIHAARAND